MVVAYLKPKHRRTLTLLSTLLVATFAASTAASAFSFGSNGANGRQGYTGNSGRDGQDLTLKAEGTPAQYDISGTAGTDGGVGEPGFRAVNCSQPNRPSYDLTGADGGDGGSGGDGGKGGSGGDITVYFQDVAHLKSIYIRGSGGRGGHAGWGGRGADGCRCSERSWTIPQSDGSSKSYTCDDGRIGNDALSGQAGAAGSYGRITMINQMQPIQPDAPSILVDMTKMQDQIYNVSKNIWENRRGARALFASGSDIADSYQLYTGRNEAAMGFRWEAGRPLTDFAKWQMRLTLEGKEVKVTFANGLWVDSAIEDQGTHKVMVIKAAVASSELGALSFERFEGEGAEHLISIKDSGEMANVLHNEIHMQYFTAQNGQYQKRFDAAVPTEAVTIEPNRIQIDVAQAGVSADLLKFGTKAYVRLVVKRSLGDRTVNYQLATYYVLKVTIHVGDRVEILENSSLYSGNDVVGSVKKGEQYQVEKIQDNWVNLKKTDGTVLKGWIQMEKLKKI